MQRDANTVGRHRLPVNEPYGEIKYHSHPKEQRCTNDNWCPVFYTLDPNPRSDGRPYV